MKTIKEKLIESAGRPSGFDYLRLILSLLVVLVHAVGTSYGIAADKELFDSYLRAPIRMILPMFFTLSGFLVAGSLIRTKTIGLFMGLRFIRIYPALTVEVLLSALVIGPLLTTVALTEYFSHPDFYRYLVNATGHISFILPGVFSDNPQPNTVNSQLWTVPFELLCYISLMLLVFLGSKKYTEIYVIASVLLPAAHLLFRLFKGNIVPNPTGPVSGTLLVASFLIGVAIYFYQHKIVWNKWLAAFCFAASSLLLDTIPYGDYFAIFLVGYITIFIGIFNPKRIRLINGADYSYGIFLYGFVVQQAVMSTMPWARHWYLNFAISLVLTTAFAAFSWHFVEKPSLKIKDQLTKLENLFLDRKK